MTVAALPSVPKHHIVPAGNQDARNLADHMDEDGDGRITVPEFAQVKRSGSGAIHANDIAEMEKRFRAELPAGADTEALDFQHKSRRRIIDEKSLSGRLIWRAYDLADRGVLGQIAGLPVAIGAVVVAMFEAAIYGRR